MIISQTDPIRQNQLGHFRRPDDGKGTHVHTDGKKLDNTTTKKKSTFYVDNKNVATLEKGKESDFPKLFDSHVGVKKVDLRNVTVTSEAEKLDQVYDKTGKTNDTPVLQEGGNPMAIQSIQTETPEIQSVYQLSPSKTLESDNTLEVTTAEQTQPAEDKIMTNGIDRVEISAEAQALAKKYSEEQTNAVESQGTPTQIETGNKTDISEEI